LGGYRAGEVASQLAVETVAGELAKLFSSGESSISLDQQIQAAIAKANKMIRDYAAANPEEAGKVGTTICLMFIYDDWAYIANIGDSRVYAWRCGRLIQITKDHSLVAEMVKQGTLSEQDLSSHPQRNLILRALGIADHVPADLFEWELQPGDKFLLCSDGLWGAFPDIADLARYLAEDENPSDLCTLLIKEANQRDGSDNLSAVIVQVDEIPDWQLSTVSSETIVHR
jgi:protein phosphatase